MAIHASALTLYKAQMARFERMQASVRTMHADLARHGYEDARRLTGGGSGPQGSARRAWLARNRPFARNIGRANLSLYRGKGKLTSLPIGMISSELHRGWSLRQGPARFGQEFQLRNRSPHAKYILDDRGTSKMIGRGFQAEMRKTFKARNKAFLDTLRARQRAA